MTNNLRGGILFGPEKCLKEFTVTWNRRFKLLKSGRKLHFDTWSGPEVPFRSQLNSFLFEIDDHVSKCDFDTLFNSSNLRFWSRFEIKIWTQIAFSKQIHHVRVNSFKHFSGPKSIPPRNMFPIDYLCFQSRFTVFNLRILFPN